MDQISEYGFLVVFAASVLGAVAYVGRRLLNENNGILTILANQHVAFLSGIEKTTEKMAGSHEKMCEHHEKLVETSEKMCEGILGNKVDIAALKKAGHNAVTVLKHIAQRLEIYEVVESHLNEIDETLSHNGGTNG